MSLQVLMLICLSMVHLCLGDHPVEEAVTAKKVPLLGGWTEVDPYAKDVAPAVAFAVKTFNKDSKSKRMFKMVSIVSSKSMVSNKINYKFESIMVKTKCLKSENHDLDNCGLKKKHMKCQFKVTFDPRTTTYAMDKPKCKKHIAAA